MSGQGTSSSYSFVHMSHGRGADGQPANVLVHYEFESAAEATRWKNQLELLKHRPANDNQQIQSNAISPTAYRQLAQVWLSDSLDFVDTWSAKYTPDDVRVAINECQRFLHVPVTAWPTSG